MRYLLLILIILHLACKDETVHSDNHIHIDLDHLGGDSLPALTIESIIPLETNDSSLFGMVDAIEVHNGYIYILDIFKGRALFAFSENGDFIKKTLYGKGPGEVTNPFALYVDKRADLIYLWDQGTFFMSKYGNGLEYMSQEMFRNPLSDFSILEDGRTLIQTNYYQDFTHKIIGSDNETVEKQLIPYIKNTGGRSVFRSISINRRVLLISPYRYHVYELRDDEVSSVYYMDFGKYKITPEDVEHRSSDIRSWVQQGERVTELCDIAEGESFLSFRVYFKDFEELNFIYSLKDQKVHLLNGYFDKNLLPVCSLKGIAAGDKFYALVDPADLDNFQKAGGGKLIDTEIDYNSNPYMITFTLGQ